MPVSRQLSPVPVLLGADGPDRLSPIFSHPGLAKPA